ncbi:DUF2946 domain-containing protein [Samsonia erythrinae]|uniref:DUF2946 domain-containing protein n=1 Tax=Samsonia erythrinae TaxID=160434 RepID=UPI001E285B8E|nr:DUF2946 domain-containing protein [Samsonia erythrinae]
MQRRRFPAWLGIFAILTIFIAPVISQTLVLHDHGIMTSPDQSDGSVERHHHAGHTMPEHHFVQSPHSHSQPVMMMDHAACGYCVLFSYSPALFETSALNPILTALLSDVLVIYFISRFIAPERYATPVVRAPPL